MGSIAFGSLLIAIIQLIRTFLEYIDSKLKASANPAAVFFMKLVHRLFLAIYVCVSCFDLLHREKYCLADENHRLLHCFFDSRCGLEYMLP